jgi:aminoglycoside phosphotransferase (APT) family kinase protein
VKNIIPTDPVFPRLPDLLPRKGAPDFVARMVQDMTGVPVDAEQGAICGFDYRPSRRCILWWSFPTPFGSLLVSGSVLAARKESEIISRDCFQRLAEQARAIAEIKVRAYAYSALHQLLLQIFPLDANLPGLVRAASGAWVRDAFAHCLETSFHALRILEASLVVYKPSRRCTLRYEVDNAGSRKRYFAKVLGDDRGRDLFSRLSALQEGLKRQSGAWDIPAPVAYFEDGQMLVMEAVDGAVNGRALEAKAADDSPCARRELLALVAAAADGLPAFQRVSIAGLDVVTPRHVLADLAKDACFLPGLKRVAPGAAASLTDLLRRLEDTAARLPPEPMGLAHGSFRHTHFLLRGTRPVLIDLDGICVSGVSADIGKFLACLDRSALRRPRSHPILEDCEKVFLDRLRGHGAISPDWLAWHRAATLVKWAMRSFSSLSHRWLEVTEKLAHSSERLLAELAMVRPPVRRDKKTDSIQTIGTGVATPSGRVLRKG